jgi:hypothetical protein
MAEAAAQFHKGLNQLALLPDSPERRRQELELRSVFGAVLEAVRCFAVPETAKAHARARELWEQLGSPSEFLRISLYYANRGELDLAQRLDEDLLRLSRQRNDSAGLFWLTPPPVETCSLSAGLRHPARTWKRCLRFMIRSPTPRLSSKPQFAPM